MKRENHRLIDLYRVETTSFLKDLLAAFGLFLVGLPLGMLPNTIVADWLFGDPIFQHR